VLHTRDESRIAELKTAIKEVLFRHRIVDKHFETEYFSVVISHPPKEIEAAIKTLQYRSRCISEAMDKGEDSPAAAPVNMASFGPIPLSESPQSICTELSFPEPQFY
jgi:hypothetical protein